MAQPKTNHVCAYCGKHYYACNYCDRNKSNKSYRWLACSPECYNKVIWRYGGERTDLKPQRTDMSEAQIDELMNKPLEQVKQETLEELKDYKDEIEQIGFDGVVDLINKEMNSEV